MPGATRNRLYQPVSVECPFPRKDKHVSISTQTMEYCDGDTELSGFLAWDDNQNHRRPVVLVVHGGAGLDDHAKGRAIKLAKLGFVVFACDMYGKGVAGNRERVMTRITEFRRDISKLCQ